MKTNGELMNLISVVRSSTLIELAPLIRALADKVYDERLRNKGFYGGVPKEVFEFLLGMGGVSVSVQIVYEVWDGTSFIGFALKRREDDESGSDWSGLYHSPCTSMRMMDTPETALNRNDKEICEVFVSEPEYLGATIHDEPERRSACVTMMYRRRTTMAEIERFIGTWKVFTESDIRNHSLEIIDHNWYLLEWVLDPRRPGFADVREGW